jgi:polyhydroxybutyrate depolymerase
MILHGAKDRHFPRFGREAAAWWARCNACTGSGTPDARGCRSHTGCAAQTVYCETPDRGHWRWAGDAPQMLDFLRGPR